MTRFTGKYALVTGGSSGLGRSTVERLLSEGATVAVLDRDVDDSLGAEVLTLECDVSDEHSVQAAIGNLEERWPCIDVLVNSAGIVKKALSHEMPLALWDSVLAVNLTGSFLTSREVAAWMVRAGTRGAIVNIASVDAHAAERRELAYNVSKSGILSLTRTMAIELGVRGIRVNSVSPGYVVTPMTLNSAAKDPAVQRLLDGGFDRVALGRGLRPEEIASACCYLASDDASGITGQDLIVDGGLLADAYLVSAMEAAVGSPREEP